MSLLSGEVASFLERIESFEQLESLLLLHRERTRRWTAAEVDAHLHLSLRSATEALDSLVDGKLLSAIEDGERRYLYGPVAAEDYRACDALAKAYEERRVEVLQYMNAKAYDRIRSSAARAFAEAFRLRDPKGKKDG